MLIVNLTTTFQRLSLCRIALISLLSQSRLPDRVNLWVSKQPYLRDEGIRDNLYIECLLKSLPEPFSHRVIVRWVENTGPYRKLIPMLREAGDNDVLVTADDDIFYGRYWLKGLLEAYDRSNGNPVAARVRIKKNNILGTKTSYLHWDLISRPSVVSDDFIVTFGGGAVLTKAMFRDKDINDDAFLNLAPTADDLWYSKLLLVNNNIVFVVPSLLDELNFIQHTDGLTNHNFPRVSSVFEKVRLRVWNRFFGFWGLPVCGNDIAHAKINHYFELGSGKS